MTMLMMIVSAVRGGNDHQRVAVVGILVRVHAQNFFTALTRFLCRRKCILTRTSDTSLCNATCVCANPCHSSS